MVHFTGQGQRGSGPGGRDSGTADRCRAVAVTLAVAFGLALAAPSEVQAQAAVGFQGGVALDPEQVFGGVFFQTGDLGGGIRVRPGIDGARGEGFRLASINADLVYGIPLTNGWTLVMGGGPAVVLARFQDTNFKDTTVGFHSLVSFGHDSGFFTELRLGAGDFVQRLKVGVGYAIVLN